MSLETVYWAFSAADAQLVRSRLEAAGLEAHVSDELASLSMEGYSVAAGGIRIHVVQSDVVRARELLSACIQSKPNHESA